MIKCQIISYFDCAIPYKINKFTDAVYPSKLNEFLSMGKPVVTTNFYEMSFFNKENNEIVRYQMKVISII